MAFVASPIAMKNLAQFLCVLAAVVAGCAKSPAPPASKLNFTNVGFVEEQASPMPFGLVLKNRGDAPIKLDNVTLAADDHIVLTTAAYSPVKRLTFEAFLLKQEPHEDGSYSPLDPGEHVTIQPGETRTAKGMLRWAGLSGDEAEMVVLLQGTLTVRNKSEDLARSEPILFGLQSREGALDAILRARSALWRDASISLHKHSESDVKKSPMADVLIEQYKRKGFVPSY